MRSISLVRSCVLFLLAVAHKWPPAAKCCVLPPSRAGPGPRVQGGLEVIRALGTVVGADLLVPEAAVLAPHWAGQIGMRRPHVQPALIGTAAVLPGGGRDGGQVRVVLGRVAGQEGG